MGEARGIGRRVGKGGGGWRHWSEANLVDDATGALPQDPWGAISPAGHVQAGAFDLGPNAHAEVQLLGILAGHGLHEGCVAAPAFHLPAISRLAFFAKLITDNTKELRKRRECRKCIDLFLYPQAKQSTSRSHALSSLCGASSLDLQAISLPPASHQSTVMNHVLVPVSLGYRQAKSQL